MLVCEWVFRYNVRTTNIDVTQEEQNYVLGMMERFLAAKHLNMFNYMMIMVMLYVLIQYMKEI